MATHGRSSSGGGASPSRGASSSRGSCARKHLIRKDLASGGWCWRSQNKCRGRSTGWGLGKRWRAGWCARRGRSARNHLSRRKNNTSRGAGRRCCKNRRMGKCWG